jgi:hypothetical protein
MSNLQKVRAIKDDSGHWYVIPMELTVEFHNLLNGGERTEDEFIEKFSKYMTGGDLNNIQLYAELKK